MKTKKWIIAGFVGILIISVVLVAGCTSTSTTSTSTTSTTQTSIPNHVTVDTGIIGTWTTTELDDGYIETKTLTINQDGTGIKKTEKETGKIKIEQFTWTGTAPVFQLFFENGTDMDSYTLVNGTLVHDNTIYTRGTNGNNDGKNTQTNTIQTPTSTTSITGTWKNNEWDDGYLETKTLTINQDGTGIKKTEEKGEIKLKSFIWNEISNGCYLFTFSDGDTDTYVYSNGTLSHDDDIYTKE